MGASGFLDVAFVVGMTILLWAPTALTYTTKTPQRPVLMIGQKHA